MSQIGDNLNLVTGTGRGSLPPGDQASFVQGEVLSVDGGYVVAA